ncbi:hypothetical protein V8D89_002547 [Ganoderma adspersum]
MFHLTVTSTDVNFRYFIFGGPAGQDSIRSAGERFGPQGAKYTIGVAGKGYLTLTDVGNTVSGPGDWAVQASGSTGHWFYSGEGQGKITFNGNTFTLDGGANAIQGTLTPWA